MEPPAVGLSVLGSFQATRLASLDPSPSAACSSASPPAALCGSYLASLEGSLIKSYDQTFLVMLGLLAASLLFALFLKGRLPKGQPREAIAPEAGGSGKELPAGPPSGPASLAKGRGSAQAKPPAAGESHESLSGPSSKGAKK